MQTTSPISINVVQFQQRNRTMEKNIIFSDLKGKCVRSGNSTYGVNICRFTNEICTICNKKEHIVKVYLKKLLHEA